MTVEWYTVYADSSVVQARQDSPEGAVRRALAMLILDGVEPSTVEVRRTRRGGRVDTWSFRVSDGRIKEVGRDR